MASLSVALHELENGLNNTTHHYIIEKWGLEAAHDLMRAVFRATTWSSAFDAASGVEKLAPAVRQALQSERMTKLMDEDDEALKSAGYEMSAELDFLLKLSPISDYIKQFLDDPEFNDNDPGCLATRMVLEKAYRKMTGKTIREAKREEEAWISEVASEQKSCWSCGALYGMSLATVCPSCGINLEF